MRDASDPIPDDNPPSQRDPLEVLLFIRALELAAGRPLARFVAELETWPTCYVPRIAV